MDILSKIMSTVGTALKTKDDSHDADQARWDAQNRLRSLDWSPTYASDQAPDFQKAQSPAARAYLESFLSGSNPNAIQGTRLGAPQQKAAASDQFDQAYGGWDKVAAQQQAADGNSSRFAVQSPDDESKFKRGL